MNTIAIFNKRSFIIFLFILNSGLVSAQDTMTFIHPGAISGKADLDFVKAKIQAGEQPWTKAFNDMKSKATGGTNAVTTINSSDNGQAGPARDDTWKAYANALAWYFTDQEIYAEQAIAVLNAWSIFEGFTAGNDQDKLQAGWMGAIFGPAAEIMRGYSGWQPGDIAKVQDMFRLAFYPQLNTASSWNGNVDLTQIDAMMNIAVFNEDDSVFNLGLERLEVRNPSYFYLDSEGGVPPINGDGGNVDNFWSNPTLWIDGLTQETCRDNNHHAQFGMASAIHAAEVAWNQGIDVYTENVERYTAVMELMATQILTGEMQGTCADNETTVEYIDTWEIGFNHYHYRQGISMPNTERLIVEHIRPKGWSALNIFYETLTHADLVYDVTDIADYNFSNNFPTDYSLQQNYPNPFNPETVIEYRIHKNSDIHLDIYNQSGQVIRSLVHANMQPGQYRVIWDGRNSKGWSMPSGVYMARLKSGLQVKSIKMVLIH
ncbi:alginate lyase family protein [candidate division KSB1 bacterium]|nr:alginate lyase family protein [candidate division KSB1 bacterium]